MIGQKKERYTEAFARIDSSISSEHYFEAITIEESIISDRIASFLDSMDLLKVDDLHRQSFASLTTLWKLAVLSPGAIWEPCEGLIKEVDEWRKLRNRYVHGLVKFPHQRANIPTTKEFLRGAKDAAEKGNELSRSVSDWRSRQVSIKRRHNKTQQRTCDAPR
jgi:hypothetical protein